jgi:nickel-type superoxide dismutase maturation protease
VHWPIWRVKVAERSMEPALRPGDWLLVRRTRRIRPGQIVLARHPGRPELLLVKRAARRVDGGWWLESDNPGAGAVDSRRFGAVPGDLIEGRLLARYWRVRSLPRTEWVSRPGAHGNGPAWRQAGPFALARTRAQWCGAGGSSSSPPCRLTSVSISSRGSLVRIAQR